MKLRELERHLRSHDCVFFREGGSHTIWLNRHTSRMSSIPRHREIKEYTVRAICKQLEIPPP